jgi:tyrosyl-tRNA synthetase
LERLQGAEINEAKEVLADEATRLCHGEQAAEEAKRASMSLFSPMAHFVLTAESGSYALDGSVATLTVGPKTVEVPRSELEGGFPAFELFRRAGLAASNSEARRLIKGGGARINDHVISDEMQPVSVADLGDDGQIKLSAGKKRHALVRAV